MKVKVTAKVEKGRVVLWERDRAHPGGEVYIVGGREGEIEVGDTSAVQRRIKDGLLVEVSPAEKIKKAPKLTDLDGIGPATARKLAAVGVKSLADLVALTTDDAKTVMGAAGVSAEQLLEWGEAAEKLLDEGLGAAETAE